MPEPSYLTTSELAEKYPLDGAIDVEGSWYRLVMRWRDQGKLKCPDHWQYRRVAGGRVRVYLESYLLRLVARSDRPFCEEITHQHREVILSLLTVEKVP